MRSIMERTTKTKMTIIKSDLTTMVFFFSSIVLASMNFYLLGFSVHTDNINTNIRISLLSSSSFSSSMSSVAQEKINTSALEDSPSSSTTTTKKQEMKKKKIIPTKLNYVDGRGIMIQDLFSATWLLNRKRFLELPIEQITSCESGAMVAYWNLYQKQFDGRGTLLPHAKMLLDWTDFNVEHLSKVNCSRSFPFFPYYV